MEKQFQELTDKLIEAGFVAYMRAKGHLYVVAGTHEENCHDIKLLQNAIMITCEPTWEIGTTWPGQVGQEFHPADFDSTLKKAIELLTDRRQHGLSQISKNVSSGGV